MALLQQGPFTIDSDGSSIAIGDGHSANNRIELTISNTGPTANVRVTVEVKCGHTEEALLFAPTASVTATCVSADTRQKISCKDISGGLRWQTDLFGIDVPGGSTLKIILSEFESNTLPGDAAITVKLEVEKEDFEAVGGDQRIKINKTLPATNETKIHYFTVSPDYILDAGRDEVTVGFHATGFESLVLYRNNREVKNWSNAGVGEKPGDGITGTFTDRPSITTVYRLEGRPNARDAGNLNIEKLRYRTVQVIAHGWNQIALPQGYPARLFVNADFNGSGLERLYGIFIDRNGRPALYSSATGIDEWRLEPGDVPEHMAKSPGVACDNKLWLIGGSCIDTDNADSEVWCYESDDGTGERRWNKKETLGFPEEMRARAGHACVVFPRRLAGTVVREPWVIGGINNGEVLGDVWKLTGGTQWEPISKGASWPARHGHAAVSFTPAAGRPAEVWIYGGKREKELQTDLWSTVDGATWKKEDGILPRPGEPLGAALAATGVSLEEQRLILAGTFLEPGRPGESGKPNRTSSFIFEWQWSNSIWESRPFDDGWERFEGSRFYMQALAFNRFLLVWSLGTDDPSKAPPKLNILISR